MVDFIGVFDSGMEAACYWFPTPKNRQPMRHTIQTINIQFRDFFGSLCMQVAKINEDAFGEGHYITGPFGCGKTRKDIKTAVQEYLGGRELVAFTVVA